MCFMILTINGLYLSNKNRSFGSYIEEAEFKTTVT